MAANANNEYKIFKYYEGLCSSGNFTKEIAKVLALGVKSDATLDTDGNLLQEPIVLQDKNWDIVFPEPDSTFKEIAKDDMTPELYTAKILNQVEKISDTVILKTETTPRDIGDDYDELTVDESTNLQSLSMYLEIYKPAYIANPEEYPLDCERKGITPQLITKELYIESLKDTHAVEETIYTDTGLCAKNERPETSNGDADLTEEEATSYVTLIQDITGNLSFQVPRDSSPATITLGAEILARIKRESADLYEFILNHLDGNEGIEPKEYSLLDTLDIDLLRIEPENPDDSVVFHIMLSSTKTITTYSIPAGTKKTYTVQYKPMETLTPEYYLNGIYIPLDPSLYHISADGKTINFDENIEFESSTDGLLVIRYNYETSGQAVISDRKTLLNNHYVLMRLFDHIKDDNSGPKENVYNSAGEITQTNSHVSPWSKLSWYQDFEELMVDTLDSDSPISAIQDGTVFVPLETPGLSSDTQLRYWLNTNNDRFSLIVMGNPSLDYSRDRHLISACYCGRIDSFENSINDTAGNFALFTSSSTEPCNTVLTVEKVQTPISTYLLNDISEYNKAEFEAFLDIGKANSAAWKYECTGNNKYVVQLQDAYFNREKWPKYIIVNSMFHIPVTPLTTVIETPGYIMEDGKCDIATFTIKDEDKQYTDGYEIYFTFGYYTEKYVITSGVTRDIFGNVVDVDKVKDFGANTSDGVTSIMMFHTRSKAYYQKHHMLFATTEEYMSKVMYGKSSYTGEYYADRIKVTHGNDGPRGTLSDLLVIDSSSLYALDELVINKDFEKEPDEYEETFVFFPITAPYSPLSDSPNARYGFAIKKQEVEPDYQDEVKLIKIAINELDTIQGSWDPTQSDIYPKDITKNKCTVFWSVLENTAWEMVDGNKVHSEYVPVKLILSNVSDYKGNINTPMYPANHMVIAQGTQKSDKTHSYLKITNFETSDSEETIYYGISDKPITSLGEFAQIKVVINDEAIDNPETWTYGIEGVPYNGIIGAELSTEDTEIIDATPDKYLVLYSVKEENNKFMITKFDCVSLKDGADTNHLLQYPCMINIYKEAGQGTIVNVDEGPEEYNYINTLQEYGSTLNIGFRPKDGFELTSVNIGPTKITEFETFANGIKGIKYENIIADAQISVIFTAVSE